MTARSWKGQSTALLAQQPFLQGLKSLARARQVRDGGQTWDSWQRGKGNRRHGRLLLARDQRMHDASSYLAREAPTSVAIVSHYYCKINELCIDEK
jgi:hypothetical protein